MSNIGLNYNESISDTPAGVNELLALVSTGFVLLMQLGFCYLENGAIRKKNSYHQNFMNITSTTIEVLVWWLWGFGLAYGFKEEMNTGFAGSNSAMYAASSFQT
jgi:ammonia channel protein AmtB